MSDDFVSQNDVDEVLDDAPGEILEEIDMRNNSRGFFDLHKDSIYLVASHPTEPLVVTGGGDDVAYIWRSSDDQPQPLAKLTDFEESVVAGGFTSNGKWLVLGDMSGKLVVYDREFKKRAEAHEVSEIVAILFHPTIQMFAVSASDGSIWVYDLQGPDFSPLSVLAVHTQPVPAMAFLGTEEQPKLVSASEDGSVMLWDVYTGSPIYTVDSTALHGEHPLVSITLSPTKRTAAIGSMDGMIYVIKLEDGVVLQRVNTVGNRPVVEKPTLQISSSAYNPDEEDEEEEMNGDSIEGIAWCEKPQMLATGNVDGIVTLWDVQTWKPRSSFTLGDAVTKLQFVPNTPYLVASSMDAAVSIIDVVKGEKVWEFLGHSQGVLGFALVPATGDLVTAGDDCVSLVFESPDKSTYI